VIFPKISLIKQQQEEEEKKERKCWKNSSQRLSFSIFRVKSNSVIPRGNNQFDPVCNLFPTIFENPINHSIISVIVYQ